MLPGSARPGRQQRGEGAGGGWGPLPEGGSGVCTQDTSRASALGEESSPSAQGGQGRAGDARGQWLP